MRRALDAPRRVCETRVHRQPPTRLVVFRLALPDGARPARIRRPGDRVPSPRAGGRPGAPIPGSDLDRHRGLSGDEVPEPPSWGSRPAPRSSPLELIARAVPDDGATSIRQCLTRLGSDQSEATAARPRPTEVERSVRGTRMLEVSRRVRVRDAPSGRSRRRGTGIGESLSDAMAPISKYTNSNLAPAPPDQVHPPVHPSPRRLRGREAGSADRNLRGAGLSRPEAPVGISIRTGAAMATPSASRRPRRRLASGPLPERKAAIQTGASTKITGGDADGDATAEPPRSPPA